MAKKNINKIKAINSGIGYKISQLRVSKKITRKELCAALGVTQQQLYKYEKGIDSIAASKLFIIAKALKTPVEYFFSGSEELASFSSSQKAAMLKMTKKISNFKEESLIIKDLLKIIDL